MYYENTAFVLWLIMLDKYKCFFVFQKIERLKSELHLLDADGKQQNKHTFFLDTKKEGKWDQIC